MTVELDLSSYVTKAHFKNASIITSDFARKTNLVNLKSDVVIRYR